MPVETECPFTRLQQIRALLIVVARQIDPVDGDAAGGLVILAEGLGRVRNDLIHLLRSGEKIGSVN